MQETLLVCSESTREYLPSHMYSRVHVVSAPPQKDILKLKNSEESVIAIGGGAVIDTAKIISSRPIICYPTTAAGSAVTSHSVYWDGSKKMSIKVHIPSEVHVVEEFVQSLPERVREYTFYDVLGHCLDSLWSKNRTKESVALVNAALKILCSDFSNVQLVEAGNLAGQAIQICPTTILHALSYPMTAYYKIPHGRAVGYFIPHLCKFMDFDLKPYIKYPRDCLPDIDTYTIASAALEYDKAHNIEKEIDALQLAELLRFDSDIFRIYKEAGYDREW